MKKKGLCSVTFRRLTIEQIIDLCKANGVDCIEWGGDIHVPAGDLERAAEVGEKTRAQGIETHSYGSYYRCGEGQDFDAVSLTAQSLGASVIRVWAGVDDSERLSKEQYARLVEDVRKIADVARGRGQTIAFEFHFGTQCNTAEGALRLIEDVSRPNVATYWQPAYWHKPIEEQKQIDLFNISKIKHKIAGVHVYEWLGCQRKPLSEGKQSWTQIAREIGDGYYYLEFVKEDNEQAFMRDAETLGEILKG